MSETNGNSKSKLHGLWALTNRELKKWYKAPVIFLLTIIQPVIWMGLLGKAMNIGAIFSTSSIQLPALNPPLTAAQLQQMGAFFSGLQSKIMQNAFNTTDYFSFMAVGMITFTTLFTTMFSGMSIVWDRRLGFLNKVLSTPVSRSVIILSKVLSATLRSMFQAAIVIIVAYALGLQFGANFNALNILGVFGIIFLICMGLSSLFLAINIRSTRIETPMAVMNLINLPLMFASNALFPIEFMPWYLKAIANVNPLSYTTDAVRQLLIFNTDYAKLAFDFAYVGIFALVLTVIGIVLSWRFLNK
ncbi:ABC transporter permease [Candidatus Bathyarchaeota archaeon]|nr:ABC transporter permease [Candidatus Bathyarchaeota archaeon]